MKSRPVSKNGASKAKAPKAASTKLVPLHDRIVIRPQVQEEVLASGIVIPDTAKEKPQQGTVIAAGPDAGDVPIGADRLVCPWIGCGTCARCREGQDNHCMSPRFVGVQRSGGYADHLLIPHPRYLVDASGVDPAWAATLSCSGLTTFSAVSK
jgi:hypothetical protein